MKIKTRVLASIILMMMGYSAMIQPFLTENVFYNQGANENPGKNRDQAKTPSFAGDPIVEPPWWNTTWQYRKIVEINASSVDRENSLFEIWINFSAELGLAGKIIDNNSIRVVEYDLLTGNQLVHDANYHPYDESAKYEIPSSLWYAVGYSSSINAYIKVSWVMNGTTAKNVIRGYAIYFDTTEQDLKASPTYWAFTSSNMTIPQGERINGVSIVTRSLLTLNSSKVAVFLSNNLTTNTQYNGQVLRMWYTGDPSNPTMSQYRVNETFINYNYYQVSYYRTDTPGWIGPTTITIPAASIIIRDNKIILQNVQPSAHSTFYSLNITYEIFERSQFVKVTFTVLKKSIDLGIVRIAVWGDMNPSIGITQITASHRNAEGNTSSVTSTSKWDCYWHNNASYKDFHGFMVSPSAWFNFTGSGATYRAQTDISNIITGSTGEDSIFQVTAPKGIGPGDNIYSPLDRLYNDTFIPKTYTLYDAKEKRASITVRVTDQDNLPVNSALVWLNASADLSTKLDVKETSENGQCIFTNLNLSAYNFKVTMQNRTHHNVTFPTNQSGDIQIQNINNYVHLNASIWTVKFNVTDINGAPLPDGGWISINLTQNEQDYIQNVSLTNGVGYFAWKNDSYNYTVFYRASGYYNNNSIKVNWSTLDPINDHEPLSLTIRTIVLAMAVMNFTVLDQNKVPVYGAIIKVCNDTVASGPLYPETLLVNLTQTGADGKAIFFWRTRASGSGENYSFNINLVNQNPNISLNSTPEGVFVRSYQNFTLTTSVEKVVMVLLNTADYLGKLIAVNQPLISVFWNETLVIQALYKHNNGLVDPTFFFASPTSIVISLWNQETRILGPHEMYATTPYQEGRYEYSYNVLAPTMVPGGIYSIRVEAADAGYPAVQSIDYTITVQTIPTEFSAPLTSFTPYWTDLQTFTVQYQAAFPRTIDFALQFDDRTGSTFTDSVPLIQNEWNLTQIDLNITNVVTSGSGPYTIVIKDPAGIVLNDDIHSAGIYSFTGSWSDANLNFPIESSAPINHFDVFATCHYSRIGTVVNYTVTNIDGNEVVRLASPGNGYRIRGVVLDISRVIPNTPNPLPDFNVTVVGSLNNTQHPITSWRHSLLADLENYFLDPEVDSIEFTFNNNSVLNFDATFSVLFEAITSDHYYARVDEREFIFINLSPPSTNLPLPSDKTWATTQYELLFSDVINSADEPVIPSEVGLQLSYNSQTYEVAGSVPGSFRVVITNAVHSGSLAFSFISADIKAYQLVVIQQNQWINRWGINASGAVSYVIENSTLSGEGQPSQTGDGVYVLTFDPRNTNWGQKTFQVTGVLPNYISQTLTVYMNVLIVPTRLFFNGTSLAPDFQGEDRLYVMDGKTWAFYLNDTHNKLPVLGASGSYTWRRLNLTSGQILGNGEGTLEDDLTGNYTLNFNTAFRQPGRYTFWFYLEKANYEFRMGFFMVDIEIRPVHIAGLSAGSIVIKPQGAIIPITIDLIDDSLGNQRLSGANVTLLIQNAKYGTLTFILVEDPANPGRYSVNLSTLDYDAFFSQVTFSAQIFVVKGNYTLSEVFTFTVAVAPPEWVGIPLIFWFLMIGTAAVIVGTFAIVRVVKNARIPQIIKDISRTRRDIKKDRILTEISIVPSKEEVIYKMVTSDWKAAGVPLQAPRRPENVRPLPEEELTSNKSENQEVEP